MEVSTAEMEGSRPLPGHPNKIPCCKPAPAPGPLSRRRTLHQKMLSKSAPCLTACQISGLVSRDSGTVNTVRGRPPSSHQAQRPTKTKDQCGWDVSLRTTTARHQLIIRGESFASCCIELLQGLLGVHQTSLSTTATRWMMIDDLTKKKQPTYTNRRNHDRGKVAHM
jgi:hypothetical protein